MTITDKTGTPRIFEPDDTGGYVPKHTDIGMLTATPSGGFLLTDRDGLMTAFRPDGLLDFVEDTNGNRITAGYVAGRLASLGHSNGQQVLLDYNAHDRISSLVDPRGPGPEDDSIVMFEYDASGEHLVRVTAPGGRVTTYTYDTTGTPQRRHALLSTEHPDGRHDYFTYDDQGRLVETYHDGGAAAVTYQYDSVGTVTVEDASARQSVLHFGPGGDVVQIRDAEGNAVTTEYDQEYRATGWTGPSGEHYSYSYDSAGNLVSIEDALHHTTEFTYRPSLNRLAWVTDARGNRMQYGYDAAGNLTSITYQDGTSEEFAYDVQGNLLTWTNRRGATVTYGYDALGQLISKDYSDTAGVVDCQYAYDDAGKVVAATDTSGTTALTYAPDSGWLKEISFPGGYSFGFDYDASGRRIKRTDQLGNVVNYAYDPVGRLDQVTDQTGALIVDYDYDAAGLLIQKTLGNGVYTTFDYDNAIHLLDLTNYAPDDTVLSRFGYTYDASGRTTSMTTAEGTYDYAYDALGQLVTVTYPDGKLVRYVYDAVGNRIETVEDGASSVYTTNKTNQYTHVGDVTYVYDADGNIVQKTEAAVTTTYTYDTENRLIGVATPTDEWAYAYDGFGNRVASTHNGATTNYVVDPVGYGNVAAEYDSSGNLIAGYDYGFALVGRNEAGGGSSYYTFDAIGSTRELTDENGNVLNSYRYDAFGNVLDESETASNLFQFIGEHGVMHEGHGLDLMRARFYDPVVGRFVSPDPIGLSGGDVNFYTYVRNDPIGSIDPLGTGTQDSSGTCDQWGRGVSWNGPVRHTYATYDGWEYHFGPAEEVNWRNAWDTATDDVPGQHYRRNTETGDVQPLGDAPYNLRDNNCYHVRDGWIRWFCGLSEDPPEGAEPPDDLMNDEGRTRTRTSHTPEDKFGPSGHDVPGTPEGSEVRFIPAGQTLDYRVDFWNKEDAPVPTQDAIVMDELDPNVVDLSTLEFTRIGFLDWDVELPGGQVIDTRIDCRPEMDLAVEVRAGLGMEVPGFANNADITANTLVWWFHAIDPETGEWPEDPMAGFLPPYNPETGYEIGWVEFTVDPVEGLASGTELANLAYVEFDFAGDIYDHPAPKVDPDLEPAEPAPWVNTIDAGVPESNVLPLPATSSQAAFLVQWTGQDEENGSGLAGYDVYVSTDGGEYQPWLEDITGTSAVFPGGFGHTYAFHSIATDNVGHREPAPSEADAQIVVPPNASPVAGDDFPALDEDSVLTIDILGNDTDDGTIDPTRVRITYPTSNGDLVVNDDGTVTYTPGPNFYGTDSFTYKAQDEHRAFSNVAMVTITVNPVNDLPVVISPSVTPTVIDENGTVTIAGEFTDPDPPDEHTVVVDWGDGTSDPLTLNIGDRTFSATHQYLDDGPSGGASHDYPVNVTVTDDKTASSSAGTTVTVNNVAPMLGEVVIAPTLAYVNETVSLTGTFTDAGTVDTHEVVVDWGDGETDTVTLVVGERNFSASHQYAGESPSGEDLYEFMVTVIAMDDDGGSGTTSGLPIVGPNAFGYFAYDQEFESVDLVAGAPGVFVVLDGYDDGYAALNLAGNTFNYYGTSYSQVLFPNSNGLFTFGSGTGQYSNSNLSSSPAQATVAPLFDDWRTDRGGGDAVLARFDDLNGDTVADRLVIEWNNVQHYSSSPSGVTFQAILELNTGATPGDITFNYPDLNAGTSSYNNGASATVGIKNSNAAGSDPLLVSYNSTIPELATGEAILVTTTPVSDLIVTVDFSNAPPEVHLGPDVTVNEGDTLSVVGSFVDPGDDTWSATVDYGDGTGVQALELNADKSFVLSHVYLDDEATDTPSDEYTVTVTVVDDKGAIGTDTLTVTVNNVAPVIRSFTNSSPDCGEAAEGEEITIVAAFTDDGTLDTHTAIVDWDDDSDLETVTIIGSGGSYIVEGSHTYEYGGIYTISLRVTDDDGASDVAMSTSVITGVGLNDGVLQVVGTKGKDHVDIKLGTDGGSDGGSDGGADGRVIRVKAKFDKGGSDGRVDFVVDAADVTSIVIVLCDGDDHAHIHKKVTVDALIDGGAGKDHLKAGGGNSTLLGGPGEDHLDGGDGNDLLEGGAGDDKLHGKKGSDVLLGGDGDDDLKGGSDGGSDGASDDILVGGDGDDRLKGGKGVNLLIGGLGADDIKGGSDGGTDALGSILIAGFTTYDNDPLALRAILQGDWIARWEAGDPYDQIVDDLVANRLTPGKDVFDDGVRDKVKGSKKALDLFFADLDGLDDDDDDLKGDKNDRVIDLMQYLYSP